MKTRFRKPPLILLELNEINFSIVKEYMDSDPMLFPGLRRLMGFKVVHTTSEPRYHNIEPWIQWVSVHTGLTYEQHRIFRLGDIVGSGVPQIYESLERQGVSVGCISPMNAENRLTRPSYFIPDPWTSTRVDGSWLCKILHGAIAQVVNDNAKAKVGFISLLALALGVARFARPVNYFKYIRLLAGAKRDPWKKALLLDLLLHDMHLTLLLARKPDFSSLFLNAGAHIQHHYLLNAQPVMDRTASRNPAWYLDPQKDPVKEMLTFYDGIISEYLEVDQIEFIVATGLSQEPYKTLKYYYRLREHKDFLARVGVDCLAIHPRMTRDFLIEFADPNEMKKAIARLKSLRVEQDDIPLFNEIEQRTSSAFVTLTYPNEITSATSIIVDNVSIPLLPEVAFVALKNGMHSSTGYAFFSAGAAIHAPPEHQHVKELHNSIESYFSDIHATDTDNASV
jgi:hypothetical protein